jgi:hypothetical protein
MASVTPAPVPEQSQPTDHLPTLWFGFALALMLFVVEVGEAMLHHNETGTPLFLLLWVSGTTYSLVCIYRIHKVLALMTAGKYPITPGKAAGFMLIPFYNLYWVIHWPNELARFLNARGVVPKMPIGWVGAFLLAALVLKALDGACSLLLLFAVLAYIQRRVAVCGPALAAA